MEYRNGFWYKSFTITYPKTIVGNSTNSPNSALTLSPKKKWNRIEEYVQYQDDPWDDVSPPMNISSILEAIKFEDELANFMLEKKSHAKGIGDMLVQHRKEVHEQYSQILSIINKSKTPEPEAPTFAITTRSGISTQDPPFPALPRPATDNFTKGETEKEGPEGAEPRIIQEPAPRPSILYQPSRSSNLPFPSRLKKQKKDDGDERLLSIFKQIHINLPFLEAMIHMPKGAKVLKDLLLHKKKLKKAASSVKLSEECSAIIQRSLPQKEEDLRSFTLPCLIGPLVVKNALADLGASINLMPHSLFRRLGISKLKPTILEMDEDELVPIILGRPFLATARAVDTVKHDGEWTEEDEGDDPNEVLAVSFYPMTEPVKPLEWKEPENRLKPSSVEPLKLELKQLPEHLELLEVLRNHKGVIAWSITDIKGIDLSFCSHKILMEDEFKPSVQPQRRVNPNIKEGLESVSIRRIQCVGYGVLGFLGVGTTFDIFQNIHLLYLQYGVLVFSGYGVLIMFPLWSLVSAGTDTPYLP
ncbi:hypothetical protein Tco_0669430 [Tanacetum coccineum]